MAVKFNKDALLKHRFWVLAGVTSCLTLVGIFYLAIYGSDAAEDARKKLKATTDKLGKTKAGSNPEGIEVLAKKVEKARKAQEEVWSKAYADQEDQFRWAPRMEREFDFLKGKFTQEIKIVSKATDEKDWPADSEFLLHGILVEVNNEWITVKARKAEKAKKADIVKINRMASPKIVDVEGNNQEINWGNDLTKHTGKLLAVTIQTGKYFADGLTDEERRVFNLTYKEQVHEILKIVDPVDEKGNGVVQLNKWLFRSDEYPDPAMKFIRYMSKDKGWDIANDFSKEAWIAQEDFWIQKEIYRIVRSTNDDISVFKPDSAEHKQQTKGWGEKKGQPYSFKNSYFAIELNLAGDGSLFFNISNLQKRRQKLDLNFRVKMNKDGDAPVFRISGLPLMPMGQQGDKDQKDFWVQTFPYEKGGTEFDRKGIYSVEQLLTWETAAIKRIDQISIGSNGTDDLAHSHRTFPEGLRPFDEKDIVKADEKKESTPGGPPGAPPGKAPPGQFGGALGGGAGNKTMLPHDLWTDRYVEVSEQSRRIPVAISLIVDQDHFDRVLTHFNNSKLRFLECQVLLNHYPGSLQPALPVEQKKDKGLGGFLAPPMGGIAGVGNAPAAGAGQDAESNVELVIYGIMTLYQRYPPRPGAEKKQ